MDYADGWTWFDSDGNVLSDENVSQMTTEEKAQAFLEGRYAKGESGQNAGPGGGMAELHSLQAQKQILQATAAMTKCWNLMKVISPLSRMVTNTEIIL